MVWWCHHDRTDIRHRSSVLSHVRCIARASVRGGELTSRVRSERPCPVRRAKGRLGQRASPSVTLSDRERLREIRVEGARTTDEFRTEIQRTGACPRWYPASIPAREAGPPPADAASCGACSALRTLCEYPCGSAFLLFPLGPTLPAPLPQVSPLMNRLRPRRCRICTLDTMR